MSNVEMPASLKAAFDALTPNARKEAETYVFALADEKLSDAATVTRLNASMLQWALLVAAAFVVYFMVRVLYGSPTVFEVAVVTGAMGAFLSLLVRLYANESTTIFVGKQGSAMWDYIDIATFALVPPVVGAICAGVLYGLFSGGILSGGAFFPTFGCDLKAAGISVPPPCKSFEHFMSNWRPDSAADSARLLVWSFVAGFAERLVPDKLKGLVSTFDQTKSAK